MVRRLADISGDKRTLSEINGLTGQKKCTGFHKQVHLSGESSSRIGKYIRVRSILSGLPLKTLFAGV